MSNCHRNMFILTEIRYFLKKKFRSYDLSINALLPLFLVWQEMFAQVGCSCILLQHVDIVLLSVNFVACLAAPVSEICI